MADLVTENWDSDTDIPLLPTSGKYEHGLFYGFEIMWRALIVPNLSFYYILWVTIVGNYCGGADDMFSTRKAHL